MNNPNTVLRMDRPRYMGAGSATMFTKAIDGATKRRCGSCNVCCTALEIFDMPDKPKPMNMRCHHLNGEGLCGIYEHRPESCAVFYCTWRLSELIHAGVPETFKPELCGFVLHWDKGASPMMTLFKDPDRPDAWQKRIKALEKLARNNNVAIVIGGGTEATHIVTPKGNWILRSKYPEFFNDTSVGVPQSEFL